MMKNLFKKIYYYLLKKQDVDRKNVFLRINRNKNRLALCDIGSVGGLQPRWKFIQNEINITFIEPQENYNDNANKNIKFINHGLWSSNTKRKFFSTNKQETSSFYFPNKEFLKFFPDANRYDVNKEIDLNLFALDEFIDEIYQPNFIKLDIQGSELEVLKGSSKILKNVLGLEVEINFKPIYKDIPL